MVRVRGAFACPTGDALQPLVLCEVTPADPSALRASGPTSTTPLRFTFVGRARGEADELKDGDRYSFKLTRSDTGEALVEANTTVNYETVQPNGPECGPVCKVAKVVP